MAKSDQDPSVDRREDAQDEDKASKPSPKGTLLGIGERLRAARENREKEGGGGSGELGDTPSDSSPAHRRTAAMSQEEANAAAKSDAADTGPRTIEMSDDEEEIEFLDDDAILEVEPVDEMEAEATMLSDNLFAASSDDDQGPDPNYDVGKTEVSIQSLDDFEEVQEEPARGDTPPEGNQAPAASGSRPQPTGDAQRSQGGRDSRRTEHLDQDQSRDKRTRQQFPDAPAPSSEHSGSFPEPADTPVDRPSRRTQENQQNPPTPEAGRSGQMNRPERADASGSQPTANPERSSRVFPKSPTPREEASPTGDPADSGVQQPVDEFEAEKTEVFNSPYERETVVPKLSALSGPSSGQEFLLNKMRNSVGRGNNNTIMVPDLAMSRRHFEIAKNPDESFTLRDLQSANGTVVNDTSVKEAELIHGDRIEAGKTTFQFLHPDQPRQAESGSRHLIPAGGTQPSAPMKASSGKNQTVSDDDDRTGKVLNYVIIIAMAVSVVLAVPVVYLLVFEDSGGQPAQPTAESLASKGASQDLIALYLEGVNAVKDREWDTAQERFQEVKSMDPDFERVNQQLARIRREKTNKSRLEKARSLAERGEMGEAGEIAAKISQESVYHEEAQDLMRRSKRIGIDERYQEAVTAFGEDEYETATNHVEAVLEEVPEHQGALDLKKKLEETIAEKEGEEAVEDEEDDSARAVARPSPRRRTADRDDEPDEKESSGDGLFDMSGDWAGGSDSTGSQNSGSSSGSADFSKGYSLYKSKSFTAAAAYFNSLARKHSGSDASKAKAAASNIRKFRSAYESANSAYGRGDYASAIKNYKSARKIDKEVSSSGYYQSRLANQLANSYGKRGLDQLRNGQYKSAYSSYRSGKRYSSSNSTLRTLRQKLTNKARTFYIQAANKRKSDPAKARALCDTITSMIAPSEPTYQKAKKLEKQL